MAQATGAQGVPLISIVAGAVYYSLDGGVTWTEAQQPGSPSNSAAPVSGDGTIATPFTIAAGAVALTKLATQANNTVVGNIAGTASPVALTATQLTALVNPATASLPGAMTAAQFVALQNVGEYHLDCDLTATGDRGVIIPAQVGRTFIPIRWSLFVLAITGTASGTAPTVSLGVSAAFTNLSIAATLASVATLNGGVGCWAEANINGNTATPASSNTDIHVACGTAVTGASALTARISVLGYWTAF